MKYLVLFVSIYNYYVSGFSNTDYDDLAYNLIDLCPPVACFGVNCTIVTESNGCKTCACPLGSVARGCDQMPTPLFQELVEGGCPDPARPYAERPQPQMVHRWYRYKSTKETVVDECRSYLFPYCSLSDYNLWRSPKTQRECIGLCYTERERRFLKFKV